MADIDLSSFSDKEIEALQEKLTKRTRNKIDWDNMTHEERAMWNKTIEPRTHKTIHHEYPKTIYGKSADGVVKGYTVQNSREEVATRSDTMAIWADNPLQLGIETCPSPPDKSKTAGAFTVGMASPMPVPESTPEPAMFEEHPAAVAARRGRPPGAMNKPKQEAA